ncbi:MAG: hypothetical protein ACE5EF_06610 [Dehalococcoidia bacterium]
MNSSSEERPALWNEVRVLLLIALAVFTYTIGIGILNGTDLVDFDIKRILAHVHAGTLGWITTAVFAAALWLFGEGRPLSGPERTAARWLSVAAIVVFPAYVVAFTFTVEEVRPLAGVLALAVIGAFFVWTLARARNSDLSVPHWGFLAALGTSIVGGVLGVLWGFDIATGKDLIPDGREEAHPAVMVVGFLIPVGLAMAEWAFTFPRPPKATRAGIIQMIFPFLGGIVLAVALLLEADPLTPLAVVLEVIGVVIFAVRMWPSFRAVRWFEADPGRHGVIASVSIAFTIGLAMYFVIRYEGDFDLVPDHQILALDHSNFVGVMTNAVFAMVIAATLSGGRWRSLDHLIFAGVNAGLVVFIVGLMGDWTWPKRIATPVMGATLLIAVVLYWIRLLEERVASSAAE